MASVGDSGKGNKKNLDFEINLTPFIDLFSVCISFSLLTTVWLHIGSMDVKQAVGGQPKETSKSPPSVWAKLLDNGDVVFDLKDAAKAPKEYVHKVITGVGGRVDSQGVATYAKSVKLVIPELNTALLFPQAKTVYEDLIAVMDRFKGAEVKDLGVSPL